MVAESERSSQQSQDGASTGQQQQSGPPPTPPTRPPPRKDGGLGARVALNSLRAMNPVAGLKRWSAGSSSSPSRTPGHPEELHGEPSASQQQQLPSVRAPSNPAPRSGRRAVSFQALRKSPEVPKTPRGPQATQDATSPALPSVQNETASQRGRAVTNSAERTRHDSEPRASRRSKARDQSGDSASAARVADGNYREMMEAQTHTQKLLAAVFEMVITEEASAAILDAYPELTWLANCQRRCPLPPGWTATAGGNGSLRYINMDSGQSQEESPLLNQFAEVGRLMLQWRQYPRMASDVAAALWSRHEQDLEEAARARKVWHGPHSDPETGLEYWHCPATGRSTWGDPGLASEFLARVAERLQRAIPCPPPVAEPHSPCSSASDVPEDPSDYLASCMPEPSQAAGSRPPSAYGRIERPPTRCGERLSNSVQMPAAANSMDKNAVRQMMAEIAANATAMAVAAKEAKAAREAQESQPQPPPQHRPPRRPAENRPSSAIRTPRTISNSPKDTEDKEKDGPVLHDERTLCSPSVRNEIIAETETYVRPECRRRRPDSCERLCPLAASSAGATVATEAGSDANAGSDNKADAEAPLERPRSRRGTLEHSAIPSPGAHEEQVATSAAKQPPRLPGDAGGRCKEGPTTEGITGTGKLTKAASGRLGHSLGRRPTSAKGDPGHEHGSSRKGFANTAGSNAGDGMGNTGLVGNMCAGAIANAIEAVLDMPEDDNISVDIERFEGGDDDDSPPITPKDLAPRLCSMEDDLVCEEDGEEQGGTAESPSSLSGFNRACSAELEKATAALSPPPSPSLMSICGDGPRSPLNNTALDRSRADSPSILVLDDGPRWTSSRKFPKPQSPPYSPKPQTPPRSVRKERPVLLGAPEPLSARARCGSNEPPLSVRFKSARGPRSSLLQISKCGGA